MNNKIKKSNQEIKVIRKKGNYDIHPLRRIVYLALASLSLLSLSACKGNNQNTPSNTPTTPTETSIPSPTPTTEVTPTPTIVVTPIPVEFSFENVFNEIFSDQELSKIYSSIEDFEKERTRIYNNITRIEDFDFYELEDKEEEFIKEAQKGNIEETDEIELREVLKKILENDPYVFDDVDSDIKLNNRASLILQNLIDSGHDFEENPIGLNTIIEVLKLCNGGNFYKDNNLKEQRINVNFRFASSVNSWLYINFENDYKKNKLKGNYKIVPNYLIVLDGSEAEKTIKEYYYEFEAKLLKCKKKKDANKIIEEMTNKVMNDLIISTSVGSKDSINNIKSDVHRYIVYFYFDYLLLRRVTSRINPNFVYVFPKEYVKSQFPPYSKLNIMDLLDYINVLIDPIAIDEEASIEAEKMKAEYNNPKEQSPSR